MGERIFVTGATGRIGLPLVRALVAAGHDVVGLARSAEGEAAVREAGADVIKGDLEDAEALRRGAEGAERIYHLAGGVRGPGRATPDVINNQGTANVLAAVESRAGELKSFLLASSVAVYGDRSSLWVEEDFVTSPNTMYGASKVQAEDRVLAACTERGMHGVIARIGAVYGPGFNFSMADRMQRGVAWLPGEGRNHIPTIMVDECVRALIHVAERGEAAGVYHVADQSTPTLAEFYDEMHRVVGGEPVRFWSTWVPSYIQIWGAHINERLQTRAGTRPRFTSDNLKLYTNSVRTKVDRLTKELEFEWRYPDFRSGIAAAFGESA
jgi:nucleoside-diphosphate-sugar epimerase